MIDSNIIIRQSYTEDLQDTSSGHCFVEYATYCSSLPYEDSGLSPQINENILLDREADSISAGHVN